MEKKLLLAGTLAVLAIAPAGAQKEPAALISQLPTWNTSGSISGVPGNTTVNAPWSIITRTGPLCNQLPTAALTTEYPGNQTPPLGGKGHGDHPDVLKNLSTMLVPLGQYHHISGMLVPNNAIVMHPAAGPQCAVLRFTVPANQPSGKKYAINASFKGAYPIPGSSPQMPGHPGCNIQVPECGVRATVRIVRYPVIGPITSTLVGQVNTATIGGGGVSVQANNLKPGDAIEFGVFNKGHYGFDSTILEGKIKRIN
jgi:hypothetical protein